MTVTGPSAARTLATIALTALGSPRAVGNAAALTSLASSAATPAASLSAPRATNATENPSAPNFFATASEIPGPYPHTMIVSETAYAIATLRAVESELPPTERLFEDPYASLFAAAGAHAAEGTKRFLDLPFFRAAIDRTLRFMARAGGKGSRAVFECGPAVFEPESVLDVVRRAGFTACEEVGFEELWRWYLPVEPHETVALVRLVVTT